MSNLNKDRAFALGLVIALLLPGATVAICAPISAVSDERTSIALSRASDNEPSNNDLAGASLLTAGELVHGSIMVTAPSDYIDCYRFVAHSDSVVNATLFNYEYNYSARHQYNLHLAIGYLYRGTLKFADLSLTENRWEMVSALAYSAIEFYVIVVVNMTADGQGPNSLPVNYSLGINEMAPTPIVTTQTQWDYLDVDNGYKSATWYVLSPPPSVDEVLEVYLWVPWTGDYDIMVYNGWPYDAGRLQVLNVSDQRTVGNLEYLTFGASEGPVYFRVVARYGAGWFAVLTQTLGKTRDQNNLMINAKEVVDNDPIHGSLDQGIDHYDWSMVRTKVGEVIPKIRFEIESGAWGVYNISVYDRNKEYIAGAYNTRSGGMPTPENPLTIGMNIHDLVSTYDGYYYIALRAMTNPPGFDDPNNLDPISCEYILTYTLPNEPPVVDSGIPEVVLDEDTTFVGLDLRSSFKDPDGDKLTFSLGRPTEHLKVLFDNSKGSITLTPEMDWSGSETVIVRATDNGPGTKFVESPMKVTVRPVNDAPEVIINRAIAPLVLHEGQMGQTSALGTIFTDPDNDASKPLKYNITLVKEFVTPSTSHMPIPIYNSSTDVLTIGPADYVFGNATFKVQADDRNGTAQGKLPSVTFNVTIDHANHPPSLKQGVHEPVNIQIYEGDYNTTLTIWDFVEDRDITYAGDALTIFGTGQVSLDVAIDPDGRLLLDARKQYYPGQHYHEEVMITVIDKYGASLTLNLSITILPIDDPPQITTVSPQVGTSINIVEGSRSEFKVLVGDPDTPHSSINYTWTLDGKALSGGNRSLYSYVTGYESSDGKTHSLKVLIRSGTHTMEVVWNITIIDQNRPPIYVRVIEPQNATRFNKGETIRFTAEAQDPDNDLLTYRWLEGGSVLSEGRQFEKKDLAPGVHLVTLSVSDGKASVNTTVVFEISRPVKPQGNVPGFEGPSVLVAFCVILIIGTRSSLSRRWSR